MKTTILLEKFKKEPKNQLTIGLPATQRHVPLRVYVRGIKQAKANPKQQVTSTLETWWPGTAADIVQQFRSALHRRISKKLAWYGHGRNGNIRSTMRRITRWEN